MNLHIYTYTKYYHEKCKQKPPVCEKVCGSKNESYFFGNTHCFSKNCLMVFRDIMLR